MYFVQAGFEIVDIVVYGQVGVDRAAVTIVLLLVLLLHPAPDVLGRSVDTGTCGHADMTHAIMMTPRPHVVLPVTMLAVLVQLGEEGAVQARPSRLQRCEVTAEADGPKDSLMVSPPPKLITS